MWSLGSVYPNVIPFQKISHLGGFAILYITPKNTSSKTIFCEHAYSWMFSTHQIANWPSKMGKQLHTVEIQNLFPILSNQCNRLTVPPPFTSKTPMKGKHQVHPGIGVQTMQQGYKSCEFNDGVVYLPQNLITSFRFCLHPFFHYYGIIWIISFIKRSVTFHLFWTPWIIFCTGSLIQDPLFLFPVGLHKTHLQWTQKCMDCVLLVACVRCSECLALSKALAVLLHTWGPL